MNCIIIRCYDNENENDDDYQVDELCIWTVDHEH